MSTEKYFTPKIEGNFWQGYEFEIEVNGVWKKEIFNAQYSIASILPHYKRGLIRVPYLTKEQIEGEGWGWSGLYDGLSMFVNGNGWSIYYDEKRHILKVGSCKFSCPCINTFRYISKLLNIK